MQKWIFIVSSVLAFLAVGIGAFAAHILKDRLSEQAFAIFEVGVRYHFYHVFALFLAGILLKEYPHYLVRFSAFSFLAGILLFSGSLYILSLTGVRWWGAVTPLGGLFFLLGWLCLAAGVFRS